MASPFSAGTREATLAALGSAELDVLVVGGGITGAGVARDAALRGLRVALIEAVDFAAGTSSRSSKLIHGGVRYLQQGEVALVRESATERAVLRRLAPHLAEPVVMLMPTLRRATHAKLGVGLWTFDRIASIPPEERHEMIGRDEALRREPTLDGRLFGAALFTEYRTCDARLVLATIRGAHTVGALCVNHAALVGLSAGVATVRDELTGTTLRVRAPVVVNAAGPWVDTVRGMTGPITGPRLHLTKGIHLVVPHERLPLRHAVVMTARDKRGIFAVPRGAATYLGTTDTNYGPPALNPEITADDADYLLEAAARTFAGKPLTRADVVGAWAGLRPLLHEEGKSPSEISRRDEIMVGADGVVAVAGGKLTTHRRMAERVVGIVYERLGRRPEPSRTAEVVLPGGERSPAELATLTARLAHALPALGRLGAERLVMHYGADAERFARKEAAVLPGTTPILEAEVAAAVDEEMALTLEDVLDRRLRLLYFDAHQGLDVVEPAAALVASRLGWDRERTAREVAAYRGLAESLRRFP
jgi:glycerol-3-phosphate dehydrogenase